MTEEKPSFSFKKKSLDEKKQDAVMELLDGYVEDESSEKPKVSLRVKGDT